MKKLLILSLLITIIFSLTGCTLINPGNVVVFSNDGNTSVSVPSEWNTNDTTITKILPAAVIAASDTANQEYVAVIGEPKSSLGSNSTLNDFFTQIKTGSVAIVANGVWGNPSNVTIDGLNGLAVRVTGIWRQGNTASTFLFNVLENNNYYYAIVGFTSTSLVPANEATLQTIIDSFKAPSTTHTGGWKPYSFPQSIILAFILLIVGIGLLFLGKRLKHNIAVTHPGKKLKIAMIAVWALVILLILGVAVFNRISRTAIGTAQTGIGPIFPITLACAAVTFIYLVYITRQAGILSALGNGFIGAASGPMIFEFPFDLIVIPQIKAPVAFLAVYFGTLDIAVLLTLSLLLLSKRVSITRYSLYALGAMFIVFAVWARFGYSYPSNPISFTLNAISKVLGFATVVALFCTGPKKSTLGEINKPIEGQ
jgi:hypothetical protein